MTERKSHKLLWKPSNEFKKNSNIASYIHWLKEQKSLGFEGYQDLWEWSVNHIDEFWLSIIEYFDVKYDGQITKVVNTKEMPGVHWFPGIRTNYAEHIFRQQNNEFPAVIFKSESTDLIELSWQELSKKVASFQGFLLEKGIKEGDRVAAYLPNIPEAIIAFLAVNSIGAVWSSTSPDFGTSSVIDRIAQIEPKFLSPLITIIMVVRTLSDLMPLQKSQTPYPV